MGMTGSLYQRPADGRQCLNEGLRDAGRGERGDLRVWNGGGRVREDGEGGWGGNRVSFWKMTGLACFLPWISN
jgi:hypothetical protein